MIISHKRIRKALEKALDAVKRCKAQDTFKGARDAWEECECILTILKEVYNDE